MNIRLTLAAVGLGAIVGCKGKEADQAEPTVVVNANTVIVRPQTFAESFDAIGTVVARSGHVATLSAPSSGRVQDISASTGQFVQKGQPLVELDQAPFQAALQAAEAAYSTAERAAERQRRLVADGIVPRKDLETAEAEMAKAKSEVTAARRDAQLSVLRSPISGVVTKMTATMGAAVDASQPLVEISDPTTLDVMLSATPAAAAHVRPGARVALSGGTRAGDDPLGIGSVVDVSSVVDSSTRGVPIRVQAPTTRRPLRIGETIFGAINVGMRSNAIVIPAEALVPEGTGFKVFVVDSAGIAHEREVTIGAKSAAGVEILEGLKAGERVVTTGAYGVSDSAKVAPLTPAKDKEKGKEP
jgi:RND family efflux transporter MFP subunit